MYGIIDEKKISYLSAVFSSMDGSSFLEIDAKLFNPVVQLWSEKDGFHFMAYSDSGTVKWLIRRGSLKIQKKGVYYLQLPNKEYIVFDFNDKALIRL